MSTGVTYTIGGVKVEFPVKAYPSQISMMDKIIRGCSKAQNCLLESPTGSGKTLALLCGALAWQKAEKERLDKTYAAEMSEYLRLKMELEKQNKQNPEAVPPTTCKDEEKCCDSDESEVVVLGVDDVNEAEDGDVFRPVVKRIKMELNKVTDKIKNKLVNAAEIIQKTVGLESNENSESNLKNETVQNPEPKRSKAPKIYFCTRTHKQLAQVVNELRRTAFKNVKNTVLSSRTHSCIQDSRYDEKINKTELCRQLLDPRTGMSCRFHKNVRNYPTFDALECAGFSTPWDLEDLVQFGRKKTVCPYFVARELMTQSDIIFCPYNYLIDPLIRNSMKINLKGDIIIVDEAHNIEDSCREAASFTVMQDSIQASIQECEEILKTLEEENAKRGPCQEIINTLCALSSWIDKHKNEISQMSDYNQGKFDMYGSKAVDSFKDYKFGPSNFAAFAENYALLTTEEKKSTEELIMEDEVSTTITGPTKALLEGFLLILSLLYNPTYTHDYRVVLIKTFNQNYDQQPEQEEDGWFSRKKPRKIISRWNHGLHFWCFNPAASFCRIKENARCVVLSSGTLSPTSSFQSELGALFPITLEANHVIEANQCWVGSLGVGPNNVLLDGKYASTNTYQFQDELGKILSHICSFVPHGVLCFVPSYFLLEKLYERWSCTGTLDAISEHKTVMCEPRRGDQLDNLLKEFYDTIECTAENIVGQGVTGVLLLAVCRGKVSEGMDFADKNARVVITVGIPYPSIKDDQILMKRSYNDSHKDSKGLLSGQAWYEIQAYRALNQALGRCIRHRRDWGAILLIDNRFKNDHYYKSLSKWVRSKVFHCDNYSSMIDSLSTFIENRLKLEKESELLS